jgi:hypothetical protein
MFKVRSICHSADFFPYRQKLWLTDTGYAFSKPTKGLWHRRLAVYLVFHIVTELINALSGNSSVNTVQQATMDEAVSSEDPTVAPIG